MRVGPSVLTTGQAAKICKVAPRTVVGWFDAGRIRGYRLPGSEDRRIPRESLVRFLKEHNMPLGELSEGECRVLVIGAGQDFGEHLRRELRGTPEPREGDDYRVVVAPTGFEAGIQVESFRPNIIVVDLGMGRSEGIQITQMVRRSYPRYEADIFTGLFALASEDEANPLNLCEQGFSEVFKKPFDIALLAQRIQTLAEEES